MNIFIVKLIKRCSFRFISIYFCTFRTCAIYKITFSESPNHDVQRTFSLGAFYARKRNKRDVLRTVIANKLFVKAVIFPGELRDFLARKRTVVALHSPKLVFNLMESATYFLFYHCVVCDAFFLAYSLFLKR